MATVVELADRDALLKHVRGLFEPPYFHESRLLVEPYGSGIDERNGWHTHLVVLEGWGPVGFTDGPVD